MGLTCDGDGASAVSGLPGDQGDPSGAAALVIRGLWLRPAARMPLGSIGGSTCVARGQERPPARSLEWSRLYLNQIIGAMMM